MTNPNNDSFDLAGVLIFIVLVTWAVAITTSILHTYGVLR